MNQPTRLIVDLSSICWYALHAGTDEEFSQKVETPSGKVKTVNGWQHGYENAVNSLVAAWKGTGTAPKDTILVWESGGTKGLRRTFLPTYKAEKDGEGHLPQEYEQFQVLRDKLIETVRQLGGVSATRAGLEGDDVVSYLVSSLGGKKIVMSQDRDLSILSLREDTRVWRSAAFVTENPYGEWPLKLLPVYKALLGDSSDKIPGATGFGPKAWLDTLAMFGEEGLLEIEQMILGDRLHELKDNIQDLKVLGKVVEQAAQVTASYRAGLLYPELVESMQIPIEWAGGYVHHEDEIQDERLKPWAGKLVLVTPANYDRVYARAKAEMARGDYVALDIETSTPEESDEWLRNVKRGGKSAEDEKDLGVDVLGSYLVGMGLTFGANANCTIYMPTKHKGDGNLTDEQVRRMVELVPKGMPIVVHNASFELSVMYQEWGAAWKNNGWHGFLPEVHDTMILASYVDENKPKGLKRLSKRLFDYDQTTYEEVTQGRKMHELSPAEVFAYGTDDTIMTAGIYTLFRVISEAEQTWKAYEMVEIKPAYLTAYAFVKGIKVSLEAMKAMSDKDDAKYAEARKVLDEYLVSIGWEGTVTPVYTAEDLLVPANIKTIVEIITGEPLKTMVRTPSKLYALVGAMDNDWGGLLAEAFEQGDAARINEWVAKKYDGTPKLDTSSAKQMHNLLYGSMGLPPRIVGKLTDKMREDRDLVKAMQDFRRYQEGKVGPLTDEQLALVTTRATTDKFAVDFALKYDGPSRPDLVPALKAMQTIAKVTTRRSLYYNKYPYLIHWKTGRIHPSLIQCGTDTRRYSSSAPNVQQLPKKGEGVGVRRMIVPHKRNAWIVSMDFSGQELRLGAEYSQDPNMLSAYVGNNLKDLHTIVAASPEMLLNVEGIHDMAARHGCTLSADDEEGLYSFAAYILSLPVDDPDHKVISDLRKTAKNVNFGDMYDATPPTLAKQMTVLVPEADRLQKAKRARFPLYDVWKANVVTELNKTGYVTTVLGARRHLAEGLLSREGWKVGKAERQGPNMKIQGSAAEQTKLVMAYIWDSGVLFELDMEFYMPVHDEIVMSIADEDLVPAIQTVHPLMEFPYLKDVPCVSEISLGRNFADQFEVGSVPSTEAIMAARDKVLLKEAA